MLQECLQPFLTALRRHWLAALRDAALLRAAARSNRRRTALRGTFFSSTAKDDVAAYYATARLPLLDACALLAQADARLLFTGTPHNADDADDAAVLPIDDDSRDHFTMLLGLATEELIDSTRRQASVSVFFILFILFYFLKNNVLKFCSLFFKKEINGCLQRLGLLLDRSALHANLLVIFINNCFF